MQHLFLCTPKHLRCLRALHAIVYVIAMLVVPIAHATLEAAEIDRDHIEAASFEHGPRPHSEQLCEVCRVATVAALRAHRVALDLRATPSSLRTSLMVEEQSGAEITLACSPRAPPIC